MNGTRTPCAWPGNRATAPGRPMPGSDSVWSPGAPATSPAQRSTCGRSWHGSGTPATGPARRSPSPNSASRPNCGGCGAGPYPARRRTRGGAGTGRRTCGGARPGGPGGHGSSRRRARAGSAAARRRRCGPHVGWHAAAARRTARRGPGLVGLPVRTGPDGGRSGLRLRRRTPTRGRSPGPLLRAPGHSPHGGGSGARRQGGGRGRPTRPMIAIRRRGTSLPAFRCARTRPDRAQDVGSGRVPAP